MYSWPNPHQAGQSMPSLSWLQGQLQQWVLTTPGGSLFHLRTADYWKVHRLNHSQHLLMLTKCSLPWHWGPLQVLQVRGRHRCVDSSRSPRATSSFSAPCLPSWKHEAKGGGMSWGLGCQGWDGLGAGDRWGTRPQSPEQRAEGLPGGEVGSDLWKDLPRLREVGAIFCNHHTYDGTGRMLNELHQQKSQLLLLCAFLNRNRKFTSQHQIMEVLQPRLLPTHFSDPHLWIRKQSS